MSLSELSSQVADLSLADKLSLIDSVVASIRKEGGIKKKVKGEKTADKPKRKAALGTLAWGAYVKHIKATMPDSFEGITKESEKLVIIKGIRADDPDGYTSFTEAWKTEHETSEAEPVAVAVPVAVAEPKVKAQKAPKPEKLAPKVEKEEKPKAKPAKKAVKAVKKDVPSMPQKEIDGTTYWHDPETNGLFEVTGETIIDGTGAFIGYFQPDDEEEPIRFTDAPVYE